jgi:L-threonylcarbamoyladenylate synthase
VAVADKKMASIYTELNEAAENIYDNYLPGPVTVVTKGKHIVAEGVESEYGTLGIRIPDYPLILKIVSKLDAPVTATSANVSYKKNPYSVDELLNDLPDKQKEMLDLIIDAGKLPKNESSTVVDTTMNTLNILRKGKEDFGVSGETILEAETTSALQTQDFGTMLMLKFLDKLSDGALFIALGGELGTGKTQLTKGIAKQLGIQKIIKSPTYNLIKEYEYNLNKSEGKLIHIDTWRISNKKELKALKIEKYIKKGNLIVIEWADKFFDFLKSFDNQETVEILKVHMKYEDESKRKIRVEKMT